MKIQQFSKVFEFTIMKIFSYSNEQIPSPNRTPQIGIMSIYPFYFLFDLKIFADIMRFADAKNSLGYIGFIVSMVINITRKLFSIVFNVANLRFMIIIYFMHVKKQVKFREKEEKLFAFFEWFCYI